MKTPGLSLASKCQLLFGAAVVLIIGAALIVPWNRLAGIVDESQLENSRQIARLWTSNYLIDPDFVRLLSSPEETAALERDLRIRYYPVAEWARGERDSAFERKAAEHFAGLPTVPETAGATNAQRGQTGPREFAEALWEEGARRYFYARQIVETRDEGPATPTGVLVIERRSPVAASQIFVNRVLLVGAGFAAGALAILVFYLITKRIILSPVRSLTQTAGLVRAGNVHVRAALRTGDEFEELSDAFNSMLETLTEQQARLRGTNRSLDLKLTELAERNVALYEAARLKGEFLANVSHELRTPLNSIIGFAEILLEIVQAELAERPDAGADGSSGHREVGGADDAPGAVPAAKRQRYLTNIVTAGRTLLEMINELLTMAKIDAGTIEVSAQPMNIAETCEGLVALIRPLAERKGIDLSLQLRRSGGGGPTDDADLAELPVIHTDPHKLQQIVFNFLSNAVKFTPEGGSVSLRAERLMGADGAVRVRLSVLDTGPGIPEDKQSLIFEKFSQLDSSHTREHQGTGLGLAIAKEFAGMLNAEIQLESEPGRGSMFSLILPERLEPAPRDAPKPLTTGDVLRSVGHTDAAPDHAGAAALERSPG